MDGDIVKKLADLSGLPETEDWFRGELEKRGIDADKASLEDIRETLADLLQDLILNENPARQNAG